MTLLCPKLVGQTVQPLERTQTDRRTDATKCIISLTSRSIIKIIGQTVQTGEQTQTDMTDQGDITRGDRTHWIPRKNLVLLRTFSQMERAGSAHCVLDTLASISSHIKLHKASKLLKFLLTNPFLTDWARVLLTTSSILVWWLLNKPKINKKIMTIFLTRNLLCHGPCPCWDPLRSCNTSHTKGGRIGLQMRRSKVGMSDYKTQVGHKVQVRF